MGQEAVFMGSQEVPEFDYYYGHESQTFAFYRIPKVLFTESCFKKLSTDAKLLYGLMLDRMSLSLKNGWIDQQGRTYIIMTLEQVMEYMACAKDKGIKLMAELDSEKGIGLIERVRQGFGKPALIYVKNFVTSENQKSPCRKNRGQEFGKTEDNGRKNRCNEVGKTVDMKSGKTTSPGGICRSINDGNPEENNTEIVVKQRNNHLSSEKTELDIVQAYTEVIKSNIDYQALIQDYGPENQPYIDEIVELIVEIVCVKRDTISIAGGEYPYQMVKGRLLKVDYSHVVYVMECLQKNAKEIYNVKAYLLTCIFNAPATIGYYYQNRVNHEIFG